MGTDTLQLPADLQSTLDQAVEKIVEIAHPSTVILFGSYAEGRAHEGSDLDLLVVADSDSRVRLFVQLNAALKALLGGRAFDLIVVPHDHWMKMRRIRGMVSYEADRYGVKLYERAA